MQTRGIVAVVDALNRARVRYLIVGGLAAVAHGHVRLTVDLDLVIDLAGPAPDAAIAALTALGYRPRAPVPASAFADQARRSEWQRDKQMIAFSLWHDDPALPEVDLFLAEPFPFAEAYAEAAWQEVAPGVAASFVDRQRLITMKRATGRAKDAEDVRVLEALDRPRDD